jgi:hypothetical protein
MTPAHHDDSGANYQRYEDLEDAADEFWRSYRERRSFHDRRLRARVWAVILCGIIAFWSVIAALALWWWIG